MDFKIIMCQVTVYNKDTQCCLNDTMDVLLKTVEESVLISPDIGIPDTPNT